MKGKLFGLLITQDTTFDFNDQTKGKGAVGISIRNIGQTPLIIDDATQERIMPGEYFLIENTMAVVNTDFRLKFDKNTGKTQLAVMRYIIPID